MGTSRPFGASVQRRAPQPGHPGRGRIEGAAEGKRLSSVPFGVTPASSARQGRVGGAGDGLHCCPSAPPQALLLAAVRLGHLGGQLR